MLAHNLLHLTILKPMLIVFKSPLPETKNFISYYESRDPHDQNMENMLTFTLNFQKLMLISSIF